MTGQRFMLYAPNGFGLGHVVRQLSLARQIRRRDPDSTILFLTDCEASNVIWREGFASVKLIAFHTVSYGLFDKAAADAINPATAAAAYDSFRPDVLIADTIPQGRSEELLPILPKPGPKVLIQRENRAVSQGKPAYRKALPFYDLVLIPHYRAEAEFEAAGDAEVAWPGPFLLRSRDEVLPRDEARQRLGLPPDAFLVYVAFGAGGDLRYGTFLNMVFKQAARFPDWTLAVALPPYFRGEVPDNGVNRVVTFSYFPVAEVWSAFDAAISATGTNTTTEILHNGIPAIFVPQVGMEDDHMARAQRIHDRDAGWILKTDRQEVIRGLFDSLNDPAQRARAAANARKMVPENGAGRAADLLLDWLARRKRRAS